MPQEFDETTFHVEHIVPRKHHGTDSDENLALACFACNSHKGPNLSGVDPQSGDVVRLFNPREQAWQKHFKWEGAVLVGLTSVGRATVDVLAINLAYRLELRQALFEEGVFLPG